MQAAADTMAEIGVPVESLTDLSTLLDVALEMGFIDERGKKQVLRFAQNPKDPSWQEDPQ